MNFLVTAPLVLIILGLLVYFEIKFRARVGAQPDSLKALWKMAQKKTSTDPKYPAFFFAAVALVFFQIWESFLRFLIQSDGKLWITLIGLFVLLSLLVFRFRKFSTLQQPYAIGRYWILGLFLGISLLLNSWGALLGLPWIFWRSRFLPSRF